MALIKASMVGWYFMHLKFERKWVYILIIPACVMAVFLTLMLYPDMAMKPVVEENAGEEEAWVAPASDVPAPSVIRLVSTSPTGWLAGDRLDRLV
jgi:cytochrome c oxidase subunit 4